MHLLRRCGAALLLSFALLCLAPSAFAETVRIGYQKYGTLILLKEKGWLEPALAKLGATVEWKEFTAGPQLLEALNVGAIDFGTTGETPPVFAQAAGAPLVYVGTEPPAPRGEAIIVPKGSPITKVADLKGKRVVLNKGSNVHYLLVRALEANGLSYSDIQPVYLAPADARAAFQSGQADAWAIWDPFLAAAQASTGARTLTDGNGLVPNRQFYLATRNFATRQAKLTHAVLDQIAALDAWAARHPAEVAPLLAQGIGLPDPVVRVALDRLAYGVQPVDAGVLAQQQRIADSFYRLHLIPTPIVVRNAQWSPPS